MRCTDDMDEACRWLTEASTARVEEGRHGSPRSPRSRAARGAAPTLRPELPLPGYSGTIGSWASSRPSRIRAG